MLSRSYVASFGSAFQPNPSDGRSDAQSLSGTSWIESMAANLPADTIRKKPGKSNIPHFISWKILSESTFFENKE
jgi:hypothetical protein